MSIKTISLSGTPQEIGFQHGQLLADQVHHNIEFYKSLFLTTFGDESQILNAAEAFKESIRGYNPDYILEIDQIASGAGVSEPLWLYAINARTELSMLKAVHECTAIVCPKKDILAQTWDWAQKLEGNFFLMEISFPDGHKILQLAEAGIIGKIGLNNQGLGVTLNYLFDEHVEFSTVPIHIILRRVLESRTLEEAKNTARKSGIGKASNLIIAGHGQAVDIEFAGDLMEIYEIEGEVYVHTNHFLHAKPPNIVNEESFQNSVTRYTTAVKRLKNSSPFDAQKAIEILSDQTSGKSAILARYKPDPQEMLGDYGTLATIVMDLGKRSMLVRMGNPSNQAFAIDAFVEYRLD
jgi:isopenicillin-N N-acyltransferase-like protein